MLAPLALALSVTAFNTPAVTRVGVTQRTSAPAMSLVGSSRRAAIAGASLAVLGAAIPNAALADVNDDAMAKIAAKNKAIADAEREELRKRVEGQKGKVERQNQGADVLIGVVGGASVFLALPFFIQNIVRLTGGGAQRLIDSKLTDEEFAAKYKYDERLNKQLKLKNQKVAKRIR